MELERRGIALPSLGTTPVPADDNFVIDTETLPKIYFNGEPHDCHAGQVETWYSMAMVVATFAGWQSGKSSMGAYWLRREIQRKGPGDYGCGAPTYPLMLKKMLPEFLQVFRALGTYKASERIFTLSKKGERLIFGAEQAIDTKIFFGHMDDANSLEAATYKAFWGDECGHPSVSVESKEVIESRCAVNKGRILWTSRPYDMGWYVSDVWSAADYKWIWTDGQQKVTGNRDTTKIAVIGYSSILNPVFPREHYEEKKNSMPRWKFKLKYDGIPSRPAGAIFDCFNDWVGETEDGLGSLFHWDADSYIPEQWPRYLGLDFGPDNTAAWKVAGEREWIAHKERWGPMTGRFLLYQEYHDGGLTAKEHVAAMMVAPWEDEEGELAIEDKALFRAWGGSGSEDGWRGWFEAAGLPVAEPLIPAVDVGIMCLYSLIRTGRLLVSEQCVRTRSQLLNYSWPLDEDGNPDPSKGPKDKAKFHLVDSGRYVAPSLKTIDFVKREKVGGNLAYEMPE